MSAIDRRIPLSTGLTYHALERGAGETTYVLVHGFLDLAYGWHEVAPLLAKRAHVIAIDLRGHGDSDWVGPGGYYHYLDYVADLDDVIARTAHDRVIAVGHSMGGGVVAYWAGARPDRPAAIALLEGMGPPDQSDVELSRRTAMWIDAWRTARTHVRPMASIEVAAARLLKHDPLVVAELATRLATAGTRRTDAGLVWKHDPLHLTMGPTPFRRDVAAHYWRAIKAPVLVVDGADSRLNLPLAERDARRAELRHHRHVVLAGAGHMMQRHQPAALAALLLELL